MTKKHDYKPTLAAYDWLVAHPGVVKEAAHNPALLSSIADDVKKLVAPPAKRVPGGMAKWILSSATRGEFFTLDTLVIRSMADGREYKRSSLATTLSKLFSQGYLRCRVGNDGKYTSPRMYKLS